MRYKLKDEYKGRKIAVGDPGVLLTDVFVQTPINEKFIKTHANKLAKWVEHRDGSPIGWFVEKEDVQEPEKTGSQLLNGKDAAAAIAELETVEAVDEFTEGDTRKAVLKAVASRMAELEA